MKHIFPALIFVSLLLLVGCKDTAIVDEAATGMTRTFTLKASMPGTDDLATRVASEQKAGGKGIVLKWKEGDKIQLYFKVGNDITKGDEVDVMNISADGKNAQFEVAVPQKITGGFDLFGVHGRASEATSDGAIVLDASPSSMMQLKDIVVPIYFKYENFSLDSPGQTVTFQHLGALQVITFKNSQNQKIKLENPSFDFSGDKWYQDTIGNKYPLFDIISGTVSMAEGGSTTPVPFSVEIGYEDNVKLAQWIMPTQKGPPEINLKAEIDGEVRITSTPRDEHSTPFVVGNAYHLYALWNGNDLSFATEADVQAYKIILTTSKVPDESISLRIYNAYTDQNDFWIDLDNNGVLDDGEKVTISWKIQDYTIVSQTVTLYGKVTELSCYDNSLIALDVTNNPALTYLDCYANSLTALDVTNNPALTYLDCNINSLTSLDVSNNPALTSLYCNNNSLTSLDVSNNPALTSLNCYNNFLTSLDVSNNPALTYLDFGHNSLTALDVSNNPALTYLYCYDNSLTALDVSKNLALTYLYCYNNQIKGEEMTKLVESLPDRSSQNDKGNFYVININEDENECTQSQVGKAASKNWNVLNNYGKPYAGS